MIIEIGLPKSFVDGFLEDVDTYSKSDKDRPGIDKLLINKTPIDVEANLLGFEVVGFEEGKFHSYICNGLEKDYDDQNIFSLNENGLLPSLELAVKCSKYSNDETVGTESVIWAIFEHKL